jgi:ABC-2 type transport system permease protein
MLDLNKIKIILRKEWAEVFKNRMVIFSVLFMPLLFTALPLIILYTTRGTDSDLYDSELPEQFSQFCQEGLDGAECFQVYMVGQFTLLYMMVPLIIPVNIAAYSIVGEKTTRSLEPLLATPITTAELLTGKNLAAALPAILATWAGFGLYALGAMILVENWLVLKSLFDPMWLLAIFVAGPLLAVLSVNFSIMVSSRVNDPRVAEQLSAVVILPVLALFFGQISGFLFLDSRMILLMIAGLLAIDSLMVYIAVRLFQRETILTRWK